MKEVVPGNWRPDSGFIQLTDMAPRQLSRVLLIVKKKEKKAGDRRIAVAISNLPAAIKLKRNWQAAGRPLRWSVASLPLFKSIKYCLAI